MLFIVPTLIDLNVAVAAMNCVFAQPAENEIDYPAVDYQRSAAEADSGERDYCPPFIAKYISECELQIHNSPDMGA